MVIKRNRRKKKLKIYRIIFCLVIIWFLGNSLYNFFLGLLVETELVKQGVICKLHETQVYILRDELVITSPLTGSVNLHVEPGQRVGRDKPIFEVQGTGGTALQGGETVIVTAPTSGVVSYVIDGLEEMFKQGDFQGLDAEKIKKMKLEIIDNTQKNVIEKGSRYCKIINNLEGIQIYLEFPLDLFAKPIQKGEYLELNFPELDRKISAPIIDLKGVGNTAQVLLNIPETWYSLFNVRTQSVEIILEKQEGILIPKKALVIKENEQTGVFWLRKGFVFWQEVEILIEKDDQIIVEGLQPFTEIILTPGLVKEGQHLY